MHDNTVAEELLADAIGGTWAVDARTWRLRWSDRVRRMHGAERGALPTIWQALDFIDSRDRVRLFQHALSCACHGKPFQVQVGLCPANGESKRVRIVRFATDEKVGGLYGMHGTISIVEQSGDHENSQGAAGLQGLKSITHAIAHELREPLATIAGFAHGISSTEQGISPKGRARLERIREAARHLNSLVDGLMQFAPLPTQERRDEVVDLSAWLTSAFVPCATPIRTGSSRCMSSGDFRRVGTRTCCDWYCRTCWRMRGSSRACRPTPASPSKSTLKVRKARRSTSCATTA
jgi:signal transduction histidine kinase